MPLSLRCHKLRPLRDYLGNGHIRQPLDLAARSFSDGFGRGIALSVPAAGPNSKPLTAAQSHLKQLIAPPMLKGLIMKRLATAFAIATVLAFGMQAAGAQTLKAVKDRGQLVCGANGSLAGFGIPDPQGNWTGFDVDFCRAIAAAIFNDPTKVKFVPLTAANRFTALQSGEIDVLARNTTWTMSRDTSLGVDFAAVTYYDGQGFMVRRVLKVSSALELNDASVCVQQGTTTELNLADYFRTNHMSLKTVTFATVDEALKAYDSGRCDAYTTDSSGLYGSRVLLADPGANIVLPEIISKEPLSPAVRQGDDAWEDVVRWTHHAMLD